MLNNSMLTDGKLTNLRMLLSSLNITALKKPANEPVLFLGEGALGDEIIFHRLGKVLKDKGINCTYCSTGGLSNTLSRNHYFTKSFNLEDVGRVIHDYNTERNINLLSEFKYFVSPFASFLGFEKNFIFDFEKDMKWKESYLSIKKNQFFNYNFTKTKKIKIGIKFSGNAITENRFKRNFPLERIVELFDPDVYQLYSFQRDECVEQVREHEHIVDLSPHFITLDNTLSALEQMDCVISSCTSIAHMAGALNKKTYILIPNNKTTYKLWDDISTDNEKSMVYSNNTTVLKQKDINCWDYPFQRLKEIFNIKRVMEKSVNYEYS